MLKMSPKLCLAPILFGLFLINIQPLGVKGQNDSQSESNSGMRSILNSSIINSGIVKGIGSITSKITSPIRGAAGTVIEKVGGALPGRAGLVGEYFGNDYLIFLD